MGKPGLLRLLAPVVVAWFLALLTLLAVWQTPVQANGVNSVELFRGRQGMYEIVVVSSRPQASVDVVPLTIHVLEASGGQAVANASVEVLAIRPGGTATGPLNAARASTVPVHYDVTIPVDVVGTWQIQVTVEGEAGPARVTFPVEVRDVSVDWGTVGAVFVAVILVLPAVVATYRSLNGRRRPGHRQR